MRRFSVLCLSFGIVSLMATASTATTLLPIEQKVLAEQAQRAAENALRTKAAHQLRGLDQSAWGKLAFWRDRSLATPEAKEAIAILRRYVKADRSEAMRIRPRLGHDESYSMALRSNGALVQLSNRQDVVGDWLYNLRGRIRPAAAPLDAAPVVERLLTLSRLARDPEALMPTLDTRSLAAFRLRTPFRAIGRAIDRW